MKQIIGLVGFQGSGKDTVGTIIKECYPRFVSTSFAKPIKSALSSMFGWDSKLLEGTTPEGREWRETPDPYWSSKLGKTVTPRLMMREFGTELVRNHLSQDFWTMRCEKFILDTRKSVVVTDVRFLNEIEMIRRLGGKLVWVRRDPLPDYYDQALWYNHQTPLIQFVSQPFLRKLKNVHRSEREWIGADFDATILNNTSIQDLTRNVTTFMETLT
jgi:hypothetical protein